LPGSEDVVFILWALQILLHPVVQRDGFNDIGVDCGPNIFPCLGDQIKNLSVPLFPYFPENEVWEQLADSIKYGRVKDRYFLVFNGFL